MLKKNLGNIIIVAVVVLCIALIAWARLSSDKTATGVQSASTSATSTNEVISTSGIHWHPHLEIDINGKQVIIPEGIGLGGPTESPIHTHDASGEIHLEFAGVVRTNDIRLGRFFDVWGKTFTKDQILDYKNTDSKKVHMYVNGKENFEYGNYVMYDGDQIVIKYE